MIRDARAALYATPRVLAPLAIAAFVVATLGSAPGCGAKEKIGRITGKVTCDGKAVTDASVFFRDHDRGIHIMSDVDASGTYQVFTAAGKGLPLGDYRVCVVPIDPQSDGTLASAANVQKREDVPKRYRDVETSGLATKVGPDENVFHIEMTTRE